ncbi:MAG: DnaD domain protein [Anaerolineae bacterium]|nr:DnaD domain protein [Anaerolineae bacterium]MDW8299093.1 DnaD domain protein [Anaerolineae bacterium]
MNGHRFSGFPKGERDTTLVPTRFFSDLLPYIDDLAELKLTLYCFWALQQRESAYRYLRLRDFLDDPTFMAGMGNDAAEAERAVRAALARALTRETLLAAEVPTANGVETLYFMNTERGRRAIEALQRGDWQPESADYPIRLVPERPNIFTLYEENIGAITPMIAELLADAERTYPYDWIVEAIRAAVENNRRTWRYVDAILRRWATEGKPSARPARSAEPEVDPYLRGSYFERSETD